MGDFITTSEKDIHKEISVLRRDINSLKVELLKLFQAKSKRKTTSKKKVVKLKGALKGLRISRDDVSKAKKSTVKHAGA